MLRKGKKTEKVQVYNYMIAEKNSKEAKQQKRMNKIYERKTRVSFMILCTTNRNCREQRK